MAQRVTTLPTGPNKTYLAADQRVTAIVLRAKTFLGYEVFITLNGKNLKIPFDPDAPDFTYFRSLPEPVNQAYINVPDSDFQLILINSGSAPTINPSGYRMNEEDCSFAFQAVQQSQWRAGLKVPSYNRSFTDVKHVVVHHSAGSNTSTNYTQVVRDIYIYHTEVNGWSDIGYNYLVAQDGTIYAGRDPGSEGAQDNVLGAHFCGANSATMGICLLGDYQKAVPTNSAWSSLKQITAFKINKENLDPHGTYNHAFGNLFSIIGHRDGCSTLCPGDHVYFQLDELRSSTAELIEECGENEAFLDFTLNTKNAKAGEQVYVSNKSTGYSYFQWIFEGGVPDTAYWIGDGSVTYVTPGSFDITLIGFRDKTSDTILAKDAIIVEADPVVFPNPVTERRFVIASNKPPAQVRLYGMSGKVYPLTQTDSGAFYIPDIKPGFYILQFEVRNERFSEKLIIY